MIRFYCNSCGKSLRAAESIAGRKSKCSGCGEVALVPNRSTRAAGEKIRPVDDPVGLLAKSDPFDDLDLLISESIDPSRKLPQPLATAHQPKTPMAIPIGQPAIAADDTPHFSPAFRRAAPRKNLAPLLMTVIFVAALSVLGGLTYWLGSDTSAFRATSEVKTEFEKTKAVRLYDNALAELKSSRRVLEITGNGYLSATGLAKSDFNELDELLERVELAINDGYAIVEGNSLFAAGKWAEAKKLIEIETKKIAGLKDELNAKTSELKEKTYSQ